MICGRWYERPADTLETTGAAGGSFGGHSTRWLSLLPLALEMRAGVIGPPLVVLDGRSRILQNLSFSCQRVLDA